MGFLDIFFSIMELLYNLGNNGFCCFEWFWNFFGGEVGSLYKNDTVVFLRWNIESDYYSSSRFCLEGKKNGQTEITCASEMCM